MKSKYPLFIFIAGLFCFVSCNSNDIYHRYVSIENSAWHKDSIAVFSVPVTDTASLYNVIIDIRNGNEYPYQNLYLFVYSATPDGKTDGDTLNCILADNQGHWEGKGIGSTSTLSIMYIPAIKFSKQGDYTFKIMQGMREEILEGISDIGLRVEKRN